MFKLASITETSIKASNSAQIVRVDTNADKAILAHLYDESVASVATNNTVVENAEIVTSVIDPATGKTYTLAQDTENPKENEFTVTNGSVNVPSLTENLPLVVNVIEPSPTTYKIFPLKEIPAFFKQFNLIEGFVITRTFQDHPKISNLKFKITASQEQEAIEQIFNGRKVNVFGINYLIDGVTFTKILQGYTQPITEITFNLIGSHAPQGNTTKSPLDRLKKMKQLARKNKLSLSSLHPYSGASVVIPVPDNVSDSDTMSFRSEFESNAVSKNCFYYYSDSTPKYKSWGGTTTHYLKASDIISDTIEYTHNGHGRRLNGVKLIKEYENVQLTLDTQNSENNVTEGNTKLTLVSGDRNPDKPHRNESRFVFDSLDLNFSLCFDSGGQTKESITSHYVNGTLVKKVTKKYGFKFDSSEYFKTQLRYYQSDEDTGDRLTYTSPVLKDGDGKPLKVSYEVWLNGGVSNKITGVKWQQIEEITETHHYSTKTGYLLKVSTKGWRLARFKSESDSTEGIKLKAELIVLDRAIANNVKGWVVAPTTEALRTLRRQKAKELDLYWEWFQQPIDDETGYYLEPLRKYYDDIPAKTEDEPDPEFCYRETRIERSLKTTADPYHTQAVQKPNITIGREFFEEKLCQPLTPYGLNSQTKTPEIYETSTRANNRDGTNLKNSLKIGSFEQHSGRPSVHSRLILKDEDNTKPKSTKQDFDYIYILRSTGLYSDPLITTGSVSYKGLDNPSEARQAAETALSIENTLNGETFALTVYPTTSYNEGDLIIWENKRYVILENNETYEIVHFNYVPRLLNKGIELKLGRYLRPSVSLTIRRKDKEDINN